MAVRGELTLSSKQSSTEALLETHLGAIAEAWRKLERLLGEFERELHLGRVHANELPIEPVKIYPPELDGDTLIGLKLPMAPAEGRKAAAQAYGNLEHQDRLDPDERQAPLSVKCYGVIGAPKRFIDRAIDINLQKDRVKEALQPLAGKQMWVEVKTPEGLTRKKRDLRTVAMRRLQSSEVNLQAVYRHIPVLTEQVRSIRFDQVKTKTTVANTAAELLTRLDKPNASDKARKDIGKLRALAGDEVLCRPSPNRYARMRARITFARRLLNEDTGRHRQHKKTMTAELPILYPVHPAWPDPEITLPSFREFDEDEGPPSTLEEKPFVESLGYYRRKPEYRDRPKRGRKKATDV